MTSNSAASASKPNAAASSQQTSVSTTGNSSGMPSETDILNARYVLTYERTLVFRALFKVTYHRYYTY